MKNVQADTSMRESIAGTDKPPTAGTWLGIGSVNRESYPL
jgi:hypothetical protein